jgi:hypothetical protein
LKSSLSLSLSSSFRSSLSIVRWAYLTRHADVVWIEVFRVRWSLTWVFVEVFAISLRKENGRERHPRMRGFFALLRMTIELWGPDGGLCGLDRRLW